MRTQSLMQYFAAAEDQVVAGFKSRTQRFAELNEEMKLQLDFPGGRKQYNTTLIVGVGVMGDYVDGQYSHSGVGNK